MLTPATSVLEPSLEPNAAGTRLIVRGGASRLVSLKAGDAVFVRDLEGMQVALLFAYPASAIRAPSARAPVEGSLSDYTRSVRDLGSQLRATAASGIESTDFV